MLLYRLAKLVAPPRCLGCATQSGPLCTNCVPRLLPLPPTCLWCGYKTSAGACSGCLSAHYIDGLVTVSAYDGLAKALVHSAKFSHNRAAAECIGRLVARQTSQLDVDAVTTVPTLPRHIRQRGYDHARMIGCTAATDLGLSYERLLLRHKSTVQVGKTRQERLTQAKNSVLARKRTMLKSVLLIDDVVTTGATVAACTLALKQAGVSKVYVAAFAIQPMHNNS